MMTTTTLPNYCIPGVMSTCSLKIKNWDNQKVCRFADKAKYGNHCTHCRFQEFCTNWEAQKEARENGKTH